MLLHNNVHTVKLLYVNSYKKEEKTESLKINIIWLENKYSGALVCELNVSEMCL